MRRGLAGRRGRLRLEERERRRVPSRSLVGAYLRNGHVGAGVARPNEDVAPVHQRREAPKPSSTTPSDVRRMISAPQIATVRKGLKLRRLKAQEINCNRTSATIRPPTLSNPPKGSTPPSAAVGCVRRVEVRHHDERGDDGKQAREKMDAQQNAVGAHSGEYRVAFSFEPIMRA